MSSRRRMRRPLSHPRVALATALPLRSTRSSPHATETDTSAADGVSGSGPVAALVPWHGEAPDPALLDAVRAAVTDVLVVDDGNLPRCASRLQRPVHERPFAVLRLGERIGKGSAIAAGLAALLARDVPPDSVLVVDADGQHPPDAIPAFLAAAAAGADLVIGDRFGDLRSMPWARRHANRAASRLLTIRTRRPVRDTQCGMRLLGPAALAIPFPPGGFESESRHLKRCLLSGLRVVWVPIPAIYRGQESSFRPLRDLPPIVRALLD